MTREEWTNRYAARIKECSGADDAFAHECAETAAVENLNSNGDVWLDPEDDADDEMSYWGD